jgi:hypothetical protein
MLPTLIDQPWHWSVAGLAIAATMLAIVYFGNFFGLSSTYRTICALTGAGTLHEFFRFHGRTQVWNLCFAAGIRPVQKTGYGFTTLLMPTNRLGAGASLGRPIRYQQGVLM